MSSLRVVESPVKVRWTVGWKLKRKVECEVWQRWNGEENGVDVSPEGGREWTGMCSGYCSEAENGFGNC